jgi:hypothetical protein
MLLKNTEQLSPSPWRYGIVGELHGFYIEIRGKKHLILGF